MSEYISFETATKCEKLAFWYGVYCHKSTKKIWRYSETVSGGHAQSPFIDDRDFVERDDDNYFGQIWSAFSWKELFELMNKVVIGDFRKSEFECIEDINKFAFELNEYIKENKQRRSGIYAY